MGKGGVKAERDVDTGRGGGGSFYLLASMLQNDHLHSFFLLTILFLSCVYTSCVCVLCYAIIPALLCLLVCLLASYTNRGCHDPLLLRLGLGTRGLVSWRLCTPYLLVL